jgi:hypothetical protein
MLTTTPRPGTIFPGVKRLHPDSDRLSPFILFCSVSGMGWDWVHLVRRPIFGLLYQSRMIDDECGVVGGRGNRSTGRKPAPVPPCPPQIPHDLTWDRTRAAAVGSQRLTAWAMARPSISIWCWSLECMEFHFNSPYVVKAWSLNTVDILPFILIKLSSLEVRTLYHVWGPDCFAPRPIILAQSVTLLTCIWEVIDSNHIRYTDRLSWSRLFVVFFGPYRQILGLAAGVFHDHFLGYPFRRILHSH